MVTYTTKVPKMFVMKVCGLNFGRKVKCRSPVPDPFSVPYEIRNQTWYHLLRSVLAEETV